MTLSIVPALNPTPLKVLAVEDDAVQRRVLVQALKQLDYDVVAATDGEDAWKKMQDEPIRLIVSDWMMPGIDGLELCRNIRERPREDYVYFILLTSVDASEANQREAADAGVDDFLTKPLKFNELWMRLRVAGRILGYTRQLQQLEELMPICSYCKKIRDDKNYWQQIEGYINERTGSEFSHPVCPDCYQRVVLPEIEKITKETQHG
jgi:sigma-B regulation protein RsbU (phosphoserine phosphatase)